VIHEYRDQRAERTAVPNPPDTPDREYYVWSVHAFEHDYDFHIWSELNPVVQRSRQVYLWVRCGEAALYQRTNVYMSPVFLPPGVPADAVVGGDFRPPRPSNWHRLAPQQAPLEYWFHCEFRNSAGPTWHRDDAVGHSFDIYDQR
jgi:hypothetical protein